jgi:hypothetical protein
MAVYQLAALTIGARLAVADTHKPPPPDEGTKGFPLATSNHCQWAKNVIRPSAIIPQTPATRPTTQKYCPTPAPV